MITFLTGDIFHTHFWQEAVFLYDNISNQWHLTHFWQEAEFLYDNISNRWHLTHFWQEAVFLETCLLVLRIFSFSRAIWSLTAKLEFLVSAKSFSNVIIVAIGFEKPPIYFSSPYLSFKVSERSSKFTFGSARSVLCWRSRWERPRSQRLRRNRFRQVKHFVLFSMFYVLIFL